MRYAMTTQTHLLNVNERYLTQNESDFVKEILNLKPLPKELKTLAFSRLRLRLRNWLAACPFASSSMCFTLRRKQAKSTL